MLRRLAGILLALIAASLLVAGAFLSWYLRDGLGSDMTGSHGWVAAVRFLQFFWLPALFSFVFGIWSFVMLRRPNHSFKADGSAAAQLKR